MSTSLHQGLYSKAASIAVLALIGICGLASAALPLNTGFNHSANTVYPTAVGTTDNYWIRVAASANQLPIPAASFNLATTGTPWLAAMPQTNWIGPRNVPASGTGTTTVNPAYAIFRKCFCLLPNFKDAKLSVNLRADDTVQVWLNSQVNQLVPASWGNWATGPVLSGSTSNQSWFRVGRNCVYVLVEDFGGHMGFDLSGSVDALGLLPTPGVGADQRFLPCPCEQTVVGADKPVPVDDAAVIKVLVDAAEARRGVRPEKRNLAGTPPSNR